MKADYIHKDSLTLGEINGVQIAVSPEAYEEIKKQKIIEENKTLKELQQELERYKNIVDELERYIKATSSGVITENAGIVGVNATGNLLNKLNELKGE